MKSDTIKSIIHEFDAFFGPLQEKALSEPQNIERSFTFLDQYVTYLNVVFDREALSSWPDDIASLVLERVYIHYKKITDIFESLDGVLKADEYFSSYRARLEEQGRKIEENISKTKRLSDTLDNLLKNREEMERQAEEIAALETRLHEMQTLKKRIDETDMVQLKKEVVAMEAEIGNRKEEIARLRTEKDGVQKKHDELSEIRDLLRESVRTLKQKAATSDIDIREDIRTINSMIKDIADTLKLELDATEKDIERNIPQYNELWSEYEKKQRDYQEMADTIAELQGIVFLDRSALPESESALREVKDTLESVEQKIKQHLEKMQNDGKERVRMNIQGIPVPGLTGGVTGHE